MPAPPVGVVEDDPITDPIALGLGPTKSERGSPVIPSHGLSQHLLWGQDGNGHQNPLTRFAHSREFQVLVLVLIVMSSVVLGVQTTSREEQSEALSLILHLVLATFLLESIIRLIAAPNAWAHVTEWFNLMDLMLAVGAMVEFALVGTGMISLYDPHSRVTPFIVVRLLRLLRLSQTLQIKDLNITVTAFGLGSFRGALTLLPLVCLIYIYAVIGCLLWRENDPVHFGSLSNSMVTMASLCAIRGWSQIYSIEAYSCTEYSPWHLHQCTQPSSNKHAAIAFFVSFLLLAGAVVVGIFSALAITTLRSCKLQGVDQHKEISNHNELCDIITEMSARVERNINTIYELQTSRGVLQAKQQRAHTRILNKVDEEGNSLFAVFPD